MAMYGYAGNLYLNEITMIMHLQILQLNSSPLRLNSSRLQLNSLVLQLNSSVLQLN